MHKNPEAKRRYDEAYVAKNQDKVRAYHSVYYKLNKDLVKARARAHQIAHAEQRKVYLAAYYLKHKAKLNKQTSELAAKRYAENPSAYKNKNLKWRKANPEKYRAIWRRRRYRVAGAKLGDDSSIISWESAWRSKPTARCYWCQKRVKSKTCHQDHITAIAQGGAHTVENLCISCRNCNQRKSWKTVEAWNTNLEMPVLAL